MNRRSTAFLLLAALLALPAVAGAQDDAWQDRSLPWYSLPHRDLVGSAPISLVTPGKAGDCGAVSDRVEVFAARGPVILRVEIKVESGAVTVALRNPAASAVMSGEKTVAAGGRSAVVYFRLEPGVGARVIALCQAGADGQDSRAEIQSVKAARPQFLPPDETARVNLGLL